VVLQAQAARLHEDCDGPFDDDDVNQPGFHHVRAIRLRCAASGLGDELVGVKDSVVLHAQIFVSDHHSDDHVITSHAIAIHVKFSGERVGGESDDYHSYDNAIAIDANDIHAKFSEERVEGELRDQDAINHDVRVLRLPGWAGFVGDLLERVEAGMVLQ